MKKTEFWTYWSLGNLKVLLALLFMCSAQLLYAYDCEVDGIYYNLNKESRTASVTYNFQDRYKDIVNIPEKIVYTGITYNVTSIESVAFNSCESLTKVIIPNSVISIGSTAFFYCI